jgi:tetratricopeptide (TPR) repeat protein
MIHGVIDHPKEALQMAREALRIRRQLGDALDIARALAGLSAAVAGDRGPREALGLFQKTLQAYRGIDEAEERCHAAAALSQILISTNRTTEARDVLDEAVTWCVDDTLAWCKGLLLEIKAAAYRIDHDLPQAIRCMEEVFILRNREGAVTARCLRVLGDLYMEGGRSWEGEQMYRMAFEFAQEAGASAEATGIKAKALESRPRPEPARSGRLTLPGLKAPSWERSH